MNERIQKDLYSGWEVENLHADFALFFVFLSLLEEWIPTFIWIFIEEIRDIESDSPTHTHTHTHTNVE
jgi:hypothetical protein